MADLYREEILEHWQNPQNFGEIDNADLVIEQVNPLCGDEVTFYFKFQNNKHYSSSDNEKNKLSYSSSDRRESRSTYKKGSSPQGRTVIIDVKFTGSGCAISTASASILSEKIKGKSIEIISKITGEDVFEMLGGPVAPARLKCAFLPLEAVRKVIEDRA